MQAYIVRRLLLMIPTVFMVTVIIFATIRFIPGTVIDIMVAQMTAEVTGARTEISRDIMEPDKPGTEGHLHFEFG